MNARAMLLCFAIAGIPLPAMAHAFVERPSPAAGENLRRSPAKVEMHFSETLESVFSTITVTDMKGRDMAGGVAVTHGSEMDLPLRTLAPGRYRVSWHAVSIDTHRTEGKYDFQVLP